MRGERDACLKGLERAEGEARSFTDLVWRRIFCRHLRRMFDALRDLPSS